MAGCGCSRHVAGEQRSAPVTDSLTRQSNRAHDLWLRHQALRLAALWKRLDDRRSDARYSVGAQLHLRGGEAEFASA